MYYPTETDTRVYFVETPPEERICAETALRFK